MSKRSFLILLAFVLMVFSAVSAEDTAYEQRTVQVYFNGEAAGEAALRFYHETPNIPYMGMSQYSALMREQPFTVRGMPDETVELENRNGAKLVCDTREGTIFAEDWNACFALPMPLEDRAFGLKDLSVHFARITDVVYEGEAAPVTIDFAKYGIRLYSDENDIYLPVSTLSNVMTDIATNYLVYNGEDLYAQRIDLENYGTADLSGSAMIQAQIHGEERPEDIIKQSYADLCLNFDYFFGHPEKALLDEAVAEKGLDRALDDLGEEGRAIKEGLLSPKLAVYTDTMMKLFMYWLADGHTIYTGGMALISDPDTAASLAAGSSLIEYIAASPVYTKQYLDNLSTIQRSFYWGEDTCREYGSTAIIRIDNFMADEAAWDSYYKGEGAFPQDSLETAVSDLKKVSENPEIRNVIFDLSCNSGGSPDVMMALLAMTTGQDRIHGKNIITGQPMTVFFEVDANFDGVFDEKDKEVRYDYNYGVLVSRHAFSCGNLCAVLMQEAGAVMIGEPSGGGSCCVQIGSDAEGFIYMMSSGQWQLMDSGGNLLEGGCGIDVPIDTPSITIGDLSSDPIAETFAANFGEDTVIPSYQAYYDDERLDEIMNSRSLLDTDRIK